MNRLVNNRAGYVPTGMMATPSRAAPRMAPVGVPMRDPRVNMRKAADGGAMMKYANGGKVMNRKPNGKPC